MLPSCQTVSAMKKVFFVLAAVALACHPVPTGAWGMSVHRLITGRAIDGLPAPLRGLFAARRAFVVEHSVDPDLWRLVGGRGDLGPEEPNHFLDIDDLDEPAPFDGVPRDWTAFVARYGAARAEKAGRVPWRATEIYGRLVDAFKAMGRGSTYGADDARYLSAVLAHYVEDANQPLHATANYDGQLTNQRGIHSRFETELASRYWSSIAHPPVHVTPMPDVKAYIFASVVSGNALVAPILAADAQASAHLSRDAKNRLVYDDGYYRAMFATLRPILEQRVASSVDGVASAIVAAWTEAGKPSVDLAGPKGPALRKP